LDFDGAGGSDQLTVASGSWIDPYLTSVERYEVLGGSLSLVNQPPLLDDLRVSGGTLTLRPGAPMTVTTASYTQTLGGVLALDVNDWIIVTGTAPLTLGGILSLTAPYGIGTPLGTVYTLFDNRSPSPVVGRFDGLEEGAEIFVGGTRFHISYFGAAYFSDPTPNDVTLTANLAPVAISDSFTTAEGTVSAGNVLLNDTDGDGDAPTVSLTFGPTSGTLQFNADGTFTYTPAANFSGTVGFGYQISDGFGGTATAYASITVAAVNRAPTASNLAGSGRAGNPVSVYPDPFDPDGDALTITGFTQGAHGTVALGMSGTGLTYTSTDPTFIGADAFTYTVSDGHGGTATATVAVNLTNVAPIATGYSLTLHSGGAASAYTMAYDPDGDAVSIASFTQGAHGTVSAGMYGFGLVYTATDPTYSGTDSFTYTVSDGHGGTATATILVNLTNAAPVGYGATYSVAAGSPFSVYSMAWDPDGDAIAIGGVVQPGHGTVTPDANGYGFTYTPAAGYTGDDSFSYVLDDGHGGSTTVTIHFSVHA